jgi:hypothetical protein
MLLNAPRGQFRTAATRATGAADRFAALLDAAGVLAHWPGDTECAA